MNEAAVSLSVLDEDAARVLDRLRAGIQGDVRFDRLARTMYSVDASIYEIAPLGVVVPKNADDVVAAINICREHGLPIIARGAGTGLTGGAVGSGVVFDLSRYMRRIGLLDREKRTVAVEPGVVLDELNAFLLPHQLQFAPDVATSSRATIGGMIANNSCGAHSIVYGRTVDHVAELDVVLSDGRIVRWSDEDSHSALGESASAEGDVADALERELAGIRDEYHEEIVRRFPNVPRSNGGYGLDRLGPPGGPAKAVKVFCGSEGTLGIIVGAKLRLVPLPRHTGIVVLHFDSLPGSLDAVPALLRRGPAAVELIDKLIVEAGRSNSAIRDRCAFLRGDPEAILVVEFFADQRTELESALRECATEATALGAFDAVVVSNSGQQKDVWNLRTSGLGLLMSRPGDAQPYSFIEDAAVDPARLRDYVERLSMILDREGVHAGFYAHASVGLLHVKPVLNLKRGEDVERMRRIAEQAADLAIEFGGAVTGEHGDGIVRSCWIEKTYGPRIVEAFRRVKQLFDPQGIMNPHKIVDPWPMTERLRYGPTYQTTRVATHFDFSAHGGMSGMAEMCSGVGQCRQRLVGTMCPSFMATGDETHTTRARANALRAALSNRGLLSGLDDPALAEVMDLCLSCKACKTECPTGVDMARLKAEYLARKVLMDGSTRRARWIADLPLRLNTASRFPRLSNVIAGSSLFRRFVENRFGLDRRIRPPRFAMHSFRSWYRRHQKHRVALTGPARPRVVYFLDTWTNFFTPQVGIAAVTLLERAGFDVICPPTGCCGRPAISQGLVVEAKHAAERNIELLAPFACEGIPIVGSEPSCTLTLQDEYSQLIRTANARIVAAHVQMVESFLQRLMKERPTALSFRSDGDFLQPPILYHAHCHQKALVGSTDALQLLRLALGNRATEIDSGCCGMAGAFGHETEHYDVARAVGEQRLFPAIREQPRASVAVSGFSCREQVRHHTGRQSRHVVELLAEAMSPQP